MKKEVKQKRVYRKWSEEALDIVGAFITKEEDLNIDKLKFVLKFVEGFERTESTICWQVDKQRITYGMKPKFTGKNVKF
tara:strand:- start:1413 stop:1649 length:237 start_codon:yes stop_codon:yes gene_type:complete